MPGPRGWAQSSRLTWTRTWSPDPESTTTSASGSHRDQFMGTLDFLTKGRSEPGEGTRGIAKLLREFRETITRGHDPTELRDRLRSELLTVMCRTERPSAVKTNMVKERRMHASAVTGDDVKQFIGLSELAHLVGTHLPMDVWKSVPALVHFMDAYQLGRFVHRDSEDADVRSLLSELQRLDPRAVDR